MLLTPDKIYFATSQAKGKHLETLSTRDGVALEIFKRTKDEEHNKKTFRDIVAAMKSAGVSPPLHTPAAHKLDESWNFPKGQIPREIHCRMGGNL